MNCGQKVRINYPGVSHPVDARFVSGDENTCCFVVTHTGVVLMGKPLQEIIFLDRKSMEITPVDDDKAISDLDGNGGLETWRR